MVEYKLERFKDFLNEFLEIVPHHWEDVAFDKDKFPLDLDLDKYKVLDETDLLFIVTVRDKAKLIGYYMGIATPHLHYKSSLTLYTDMFYILKEHRKGLTGYNLFKAVEKEAKKKGIERIYLGCTTRVDVSPIFKRLGYNKIETNFSKVI